MTDKAEAAAIEELERNVREACASPAASFYQVALSIHKLQLLDRSWAARLTGKVGLCRRRLYHLSDVGQLISQFEIPEAEALSVGVTKLVILARHLREQERFCSDDVGELLDLARGTKVIKLARVLEGQKPRETKAFVFHLNKTETSLLRQTLLEFGAKPARNGGLIRKEHALRKLLREYWSDEA